MHVALTRTPGQIASYLVTYVGSYTSSLSLFPKAHPHIAHDLWALLTVTPCQGGGISITYEMFS